jgi:septal ring factor EnvC (AmiA/AmiB activator)
MTNSVRSPRGFTYALEPVRQRRKWQLDAQLSNLAASQQKLAEERARLAQIEQACTQESARAARLWTERADPRTQGRLLGYLATLHQHRADAEQRIAKLTEAVKDVRAKCVVLQQRLEVLNQHHCETVRQHVVEHDRKTASEADREWLARNGRSPVEDVA